MKKEQIIKCWKHIKECFGDIPVDDLDAYSYEQAGRLVEDGCFCCYFDSARKFLQELYDESDEEAEQYDNATVWARYKHVLALAISKHFRYSKINV